MPLRASEICKKVVDRMDAFRADAPQWNDVTLAVVKLKSEVVDFSMVKTEQRNGHGD